MTSGLTATELVGKLRDKPWFITQGSSRQTESVQAVFLEIYCLELPYAIAGAGEEFRNPQGGPPERADWNCWMPAETAVRVEFLFPQIFS